jgi:uncharacterized protein (TIGR04206 family)
MIASFLNGVAAMACLAVATFFVRFWHESEDRVFACLAAALWIFAVNYALLGLLPDADDRRAYAFALRLIGFVAILVGIMVKSRELAEYMRFTDRAKADASSTRLFRKRW